MRIPSEKWQRLNQLFVAAYGILLFGLSITNAEQYREALQGGTFEENRDYWGAIFYTGGSVTSAGIRQGENAYQGSWYGYCGDLNSSTFNANGALYQWLNPRTELNAIRLDVSYYLNITSAEGTTTEWDTLDVLLRFFDRDLNLLREASLAHYSNRNKDPSGNPTNYLPRSHQFVLGALADKDTYLIFKVRTDGNNYTTFRIDDVRVTVVRPDPVYLVDAFVIPAADGINHGTINPSGIIHPVAQGDSITFTAIPDIGFTVDHWVTNGFTSQTGGTEYRLSNIRANYAVSVQFAERRYVVEASAGMGGMVSPIGVIEVRHGNSINFTASPNEGYDVDTWYVNGTAAQMGGTAFELSNVTGARTVFVSFLEKRYRLEIVVSGQGTYSVSPASFASIAKGNRAIASSTYLFHPGTTVTLSAFPSVSYQFSEWLGDIFGRYSRNGIYSFQMANRHERINLTFLPLPSPIPLIIAPASTVPSAFTFVAPTTLGWLTVCEKSRDSVVWVPICAHEGDGSTVTHDITIDQSNLTELRRSLDYPKTATPRFMSFPLKNDLDGNPITLANAKVSAILDHTRRYAGESGKRDETIVTLKSSALQVLAATKTFKNQETGLFVESDGLLALVEPSVQSVLMLPFNYVGTRSDGPSALQYDGHDGYDYAYGTGTKVYAVDTGETVVDVDFAAFTDFPNVPTVPSTHMRDFHYLIIKHPSGYYSVYGHLSTIESKFVDTSDPSNWKPRKAPVMGGEIIGEIGNQGALSPHLHFNVWLGEGKKLRIVDPYGRWTQNGIQIEPSLWSQ